MKVAFFVYPWAMQTPGGGEIMLLKTKEALEKKGVSVTLFDQWSDKLRDFDILHVFGSVKDCLGLMEAAHREGTAVVLSSVYWSTLTRACFEYGSFSKKAFMALQHIIKVIMPAIPSARRKMFRIADVILPNSEVEGVQVSRLFAINKEKMRIVRLGADERFLKAEKQEFIRTFNVNDFILSVGRFEPRKNQLNLIRAMKDFGKQLVFIGNPAIGYEKYYELCKKEAPADTLFIERLEHSDSLLASAYAASSVFVLQGWFETPGLVALEAGLSGARLAVTSGGSTKEYFKDYVEYFNPASLQSIRLAIVRALAGPGGNQLRDHIAQNFLWSNAADENMRVYRDLIK